MFDYLIEENKLTNEFKKNDLEFVRDLILCPKKKVIIYYSIAFNS